METESDIELEQPKKRGRPKSSGTGTSKKRMVIPRAGKVEGRPDRIPMGAGMNLHVPQAILDDIESQNCVCRWGLDNDKGRMQQYTSAKWVPYITADGHEYTAASGNVRRFMLLVLDKGFWDEAQLLKRKRNNASLDAESQLKPGEYIPNDQSTVMVEDQYG